MSLPTRRRLVDLKLAARALAQAPLPSQRFTKDSLSKQSARFATEVGSAVLGRIGHEIATRNRER